MVYENIEKNRAKHFWLYVLKLEQGKWYVGISTNVEKRFQQHKHGFASAAWTKKYKPIKIHYTQDLGNCDLEKAQLYEGRVTRKYMEKHGDNNVRGGDLTSTDDYIMRFGYFFDRFSWETLTTIVLLMLVIVILVADKYL